MAVNVKQRAKFAPLLQVDAPTFTGSGSPNDPPGYQLIGILDFNPTIIWFQNDTNQDVYISDNKGVDDALFLAAGTKTVVDLRAAHGIAANYTFPLFTEFWINGAAGTGIFTISYLYAE